MCKNCLHLIAWYVRSLQDMLTVCFMQCCLIRVLWWWSRFGLKQVGTSCVVLWHKDLREKNLVHFVGWLVNWLSMDAWNEQQNCTYAICAPLTLISADETAGREGRVGAESQITGAWWSGRGPRARLWCTFFVFLGVIIICRLYKLTLSHKAQVTLQLRIILSDAGRIFLSGSEPLLTAQTLILVSVTWYILHTHRFLNDCSYRNCTWPGAQIPLTSLYFRMLEMQGKQYPTLCSDISCSVLLCIVAVSDQLGPLTRMK